MHKTLFSILITGLFLFGVAKDVTAANLEVIFDAKKQVPPTTEISIPVYVKYDTAFNAVSMDVALKNGTFNRAEMADNWTAVVGPTVDADAVSFVGAVLGANASVMGKQKILTLQLLTPAEGVVTLSAKSSIALMDQNATQVEVMSVPITMTVSAAAAVTDTPKDQAANYLASLMVNPVSLYAGLGVAVILFGFVMFLVIRHRSKR